MSFLQFFRVLWARRWIVIAATSSCFLAALLVALLVPARYESSSRVMLDVVKPDPVTGQIIANQFARAYTKTQTELIRDYRVAGAVVDQLGWTSSPQLLAQFNASSKDENRDFRRWLAQIVIAGTRANLIEGSNILEITYSSTSPETARTIADALRSAYVNQSLTFKREGAAKTAAFFGQQVEKVRGQLAAAESRKTAFERANRIVLQDDDSDVETARLKALAGSAPAAPAMAAGAVATASPAALQLAQLDAQISTAAQSLGPNHPELQDLRRRRAALAGAAAQERQAANSAARVGGSEGPSLTGQVQAQQGRVMAQRDKLEELRRLNADVVVLRDQYNKTAARAADLSQQADSNETGLTLLGAAVTPEKAVFPNLPLILFGSLAFGLGLGVLAALITELLSRRVRGIEDLAQTGVPVIIVLGGSQEGSRQPALTGLRRRLLGAS